ncbi:MAG: helix-turn-helix transcriptional regulator [Novosphingobium sp.]
MSAPDRPPNAFATLTDKEVEVLRLLAAGHTVKSIAFGLGRSETSINERLRDARRKTGVGSSRELARLLDAQKIWDKNIDLSTWHAAADEAVQPANAGRPSLKGTIIMLITLPASAVGLFLIAANSMNQAAPQQAVQVTESQQMPLAGTWALDVSRVPAEERPRQVTIVFRVSDDQKWTTLVDIVGPDGSSMHAESTAALNGAPVPIGGNMSFIDTVSLRQPEPNTLVMTLGKDGTAISTRVYTVAKDRKSMTETIIWAGKKVPKLETNHFNRID